MNGLKQFGLATLASALLLGTAWAAHHEEKETMKGMPLVYEADFSEGLDDWKFMDPSAWEVIEDEGQKVMASTEDSDYSPEVRSPVNIAILKDVDVSDFVVVAELKSTQPAYNHRDMCIIFGYQSPSNYYYTHIAPAPNSDPHANSIFLVNDEPRVSIAHKRNDGTAWSDNQYHTVMVVRDTEAGTIDVYFDDMETPILQAKDKTFTHGQFGVGAFDDIGNIKSYKVYGKK